MTYLPDTQVLLRFRMEIDFGVFGDPEWLAHVEEVFRGDVVVQVVESHFLLDWVSYVVFVILQEKHVAIVWATEGPSSKDRSKFRTAQLLTC